MADETDGLASAINDFFINNQSTASTSSDVQTKRRFDQFKTDVVNGISGEWEEIIKKVTQDYNAEWFVTLLNDILYKGTKPEKNCWLICSIEKIKAEECGRLLIKFSIGQHLYCPMMGMS